MTLKTKDDPILFPTQTDAKVIFSMQPDAEEKRLIQRIKLRSLLIKNVKLGRFEKHSEERGLLIAETYRWGELPVIINDKYEMQITGGTDMSDLVAIPSADLELKRDEASYYLPPKVSYAIRKSIDSDENKSEFVSNIHQQVNDVTWSDLKDDLTERSALDPVSKAEYDENATDQTLILRTTINEETKPAYIFIQIHLKDGVIVMDDKTKFLERREYKNFD